jgi:RIO kinase 2
MTRDEFRVLTAVEMGMKNHELVPLPLVVRIAGLRHGGVNKLINNVLRNKLVVHEGGRNDGYRLTYAGYDYLALRTFIAREKIIGIGRQIGVGKESDIFLAETAEGDHVALKFHRLGRTSFRAVKNVSLVCICRPCMSQ